eukprot:SAG31_NODE_752_length_12351_cov_14.467516_5_plen_135_part_00
MYSFFLVRRQKPPGMGLTEVTDRAGTGRGPGHYCSCGRDPSSAPRLWLELAAPPNQGSACTPGPELGADLERTELLSSEQPSSRRQRPAGDVATAAVKIRPAPLTVRPSCRIVFLSLGGAIKFFKERGWVGEPR